MPPQNPVLESARGSSVTYEFMNEHPLTLERPVRRVRPDIYSVLGDGGHGSRYDARAAAYDRVVGSRLYNRIVWGVSVDRYRTFVRRALATGDGAFLDAGAGSAVFTADAYARTSRPLLLVDNSLGMLEAARDRIAERAGGTVPESVMLLQADALDLPLDDERVDTVLSMGLFHLVDDIISCLTELSRVLAPGGQLYATSLVSERAIGRAYLRLLTAAGEIAAARSRTEYQTHLEEIFDGPVTSEREGNMAFLYAEKLEAADEDGGSDGG